MKGKKTGGRIKGKPNKSTLEIRQLIDSCVDFNEVFSKLYELTKGVEVQKLTDDGNIVYTKPPDPFAAKILIEHRFGKAPQAIDITSDNKPLTQNVITLANGTIISI